MALLQILDYLLRMFIQLTTLEAGDRQTSSHDLWGRETGGKFTLPAMPWAIGCLHSFGLALPFPIKCMGVWQTNPGTFQHAALWICLATWNTSARLTLKLHTLWFHLHDNLEKAKWWTKNRSVVARGKRESLTTKGQHKETEDGRYCWILIVVVITWLKVFVKTQRNMSELYGI